MLFRERLPFVSLYQSWGDSLHTVVYLEKLDLMWKEGRGRTVLVYN